jgi:hypothetical protein
MLVDFFTNSVTGSAGGFHRVVVLVQSGTNPQIPPYFRAVCVSLWREAA